MEKIDYTCNMKDYKDMNEAEQAIMDALQTLEFLRNNNKGYEPSDAIEVLQELAEKLNLVEKKPKEKDEGFEMPF